MLVDANIVLRLILQDDEELFRQSRQVLEASAELILIVSPVIAAEIIYVLAGHGYARSQSVQVLSLVLEQRAFAEHNLLKETLAYYSATNLDFADCYLLARALREGKDLKTLDMPLKRAYTKALSIRS